jgi:hypothetical protein
MMPIFQSNIIALEIQSFSTEKIKMRKRGEEEMEKLVGKLSVCQTIKLLLYTMAIFAIALGLMPGAVITARADGGDYAGYIPKDTDSIEELNAKKVKFNGYEWYIIADNSKAVDATVTLLAAEPLDASDYGTSSEYTDSKVKKYLDGLTYEDGPFAGVLNLIAETDLYDVDLLGTKIYLLSTSESANLPGGNSVRKCSQASGATSGNYWWLRSKGTGYGMACIDGSTGEVCSYGGTTNSKFSIRPALRLDLSKVLFSSESKSFTASNPPYNLLLSGGANTTHSGGDTNQLGVVGAIEPVIFTANDGYCFDPEPSSLGDNYGITVECINETTLKVWGTLLGYDYFDILIPDAVPIPNCVISFNANGGTGSMASVEVKRYSSYILPDCTFTAPVGKEFYGWGFSCLTPGTSVKVNMDMNFPACWDDIRYYNIAVSDNGNGAAKASVSNACKEQLVTLTASPNSGYRFKEWQVISGNVSVINNSFTMGNSDVVLKAIFEEIKYGVTVNNGTGDGEYRPGDTVTITADAPANGKVFDKWTSNDGVTFADAAAMTTTFKMSSKAVAVTATYKDKEVVAPTNKDTDTKRSIAKATFSGVKNRTYTGKAITQKLTVKLSGKKLIAGTDYTVSYKNNKKVGTATITITGKGKYTGKATATFKIKKATNSLSVKVKKRTYNITYTKLAKKDQSIKEKQIYTISKKGQGKLSYALSSAKKGKKILKTSFVVDKQTGKLTAKKGLKKGTYNIAVNVTAAGDKSHIKVTKTISFSIKVK